LNEVKRAAGYIRVSTIEQSLKNTSIETQIAEIKNYAKLHNMKLVDIYIDRGITARKSLEKRVDFMRMMRDVESGKVNHIIVLRLDRFFRNVYDYHKMMNEYLEPNNCDWSAVKESYTTETTNGRLMINLRLSIAEQECDTDSDRIKDVLNHRASQGYAITGSLPMGLKIVDHRVVPDEEKRHIIVDIFKKMELFSSVRKTLFYINDTYGLKMFYGSLMRLIKNPMFYGNYRGMDNYCEPIITKEQFDRVQNLIKNNVRLRKNNHIYIFSGLVVCDHCGGKHTGIYSESNKKYFFYRCNKARVDGKCENKTSISHKNLENYLLENVERLLKEYIISVELSEKEPKQQKSNRKAIEIKMQRLNDLYVNGFIDMEKYRSDYAKLQEQIIEIPEEQPKKDFTELKTFLESDFKNVYNSLTDIQKQSLWRKVIKEIRVSGKNIVDIKFL
jgi:DNA invertase Pin-like site-specific DNA recombinase